MRVCLVTCVLCDMRGVCVEGCEGAVCADLGLRHRSAAHQLKVLTAEGKAMPNPTVLSRVAGTQVLDRTWLTLKSWLPRLIPKVKVQQHSKVNHQISGYIHQFAWRQSLGAVETAGALLRHLCTVVRRNRV